MKPRFAVCTLFLFAAFTEAAIYHVKADATGDGSGTSWANAMTSLSTALADISADSGDEIWIAAGTYRPETAGLAEPREATFAVPSGTGVYGGFAGTETDRTQRDPQINGTVLSGDLSGNDVAGGEWHDASHAENTYHVVTLANTCSSTTLDGLVITGGYDERTHWHECNSPAGDCGYLHADGQGAGVLIVGGGPTISNCIFQHNNVRGFGAGLFAQDSTVSISRCTFYDNTAWTTTNGGGGGAALSQCVSTLANCVFVRNYTTHSGGAVNVTDGSVTLLNSTAFGNTGGAIFVSRGTLIITNCIAYGNPVSSDYMTLTESQIRYSAYDPDPPAVTYSCVEGGWTEAGGVGNIDADPLFVNTTTGDLHLTADSPCIDTGNSAAAHLPDTDRDGKARIIGNAVDMGAYEFDSTPAANDPPPAADDAPPAADDPPPAADDAPPAADDPPPAEDVRDEDASGNPLDLPLCGAGMVSSLPGCFCCLAALRRRT